VVFTVDIMTRAALIRNVIMVPHHRNT